MRNNIENVSYFSSRNAAKRNTKRLGGLGKVLATGALAVAALVAPLKSKGNVIYDSGYQTASNNVPSGTLDIDYKQTIETIDTDSDGTDDSYKSDLWVKNRTLDIGDKDGSYFLLDVNAELAGKGCTGLTNYWGDWHYEVVEENQKGRYTMNEQNSYPLTPTEDDRFYYTISMDKVIGWETVDTSIKANAGYVDFTTQTPVVPEPATMALLGAGALTALGIRRFRDRK